MCGRPDDARRAFADARASNTAIGQFAEVGAVLANDLWAVLTYRTDHLVERERLAAAGEQAAARASEGGESFAATRRTGAAPGARRRLGRGPSAYRDHAADTPGARDCL